MNAFQLGILNQETKKFPGLLQGDRGINITVLIVFVVRFLVSTFS